MAAVADLGGKLAGVRIAGVLQQDLCRNALTYWRQRETRSSWSFPRSRILPTLATSAYFPSLTIAMSWGMRPFQ